MAKLKNIFETAFTVSGLNNLRRAKKETQEYAEAVDNVGQESIRASNASAAAGRRFSSQARGLGGFVGIYAGAAASVFALSQAYETLSRAARVDTTIAGTRALARAVGSSADEILSNIDKITAGQLSIAQSAEIANVALSAGFNSEQISSLTEVALKASRALGRDLTDSFNRIVRGVAKLEPELLDELGIFTKLGPATEKYAENLGVAVTSLTEFQRRQAFANAAIEEGSRKFGLIQVSTESSQASLERLAASFSNLTQKATSVLANTLAPVIDVITSSFGNLYSVLTLIGTIVFRNLGKEAAFVLTGVVENIKQAEANTARYKSEVQNLQKAFDDLAGKTPDVKGRKISIEEFFKAEGGRGFVGLGREENIAAREAVKRAAGGRITSFAQLTKDIEVLKKVEKAEESYQRKIERSNKTAEQKNKLLDQSAARQLAAAEILGAFEGKVEAATRKTRIFGAATFALGKAFNFFSKAATIAGASLNWVFLLGGIAQTVGSFFGVDVLGSVVSFFKNLGEASKEAKSGIEGIAVAAINARQADIKNLGFSEEDLKNIKNRAQELIETNRDLNKNLTQEGISQETFKSVTKPIEEDINSLILAGTGLQLVTKTYAQTGRTSIELTGTINQESQRLAGTLVDLAQQYAKAETEAEKFAITIAAAAIREGAQGFASIIGQLSKITGIPTDELAKSISNLKDETSDFLKVNGIVVGQVVKGQASLFDSTKKLAGAYFLYEGASDRLNKSLASGRASGEAASQEFEAVRTTLERLNKEIEKTVGPGDLFVSIETLDALEVRRKALEAQKNEVFALIKAEQNLAGIRKTYSKEIQAFSDLQTSGLVTNGKIAQSEKEIQINRLKNLEATISTGAEAEKILKEGLEIDDARLSTLNKQKEAAQEAFKAAIGGSITLIQETRNLNKELDKRTTSLQEEIRLLVLQNTVAKARLAIESETSRQRIEQERSQREISILQVRLDLAKQEADKIKQLFDLTKKRAEAERELADATTKRVSSEASLAATRLQVSRAATIRGLRRQEQQQELFSGLFSGADRVALQRTIAREEYELQKDILNEKSRIAQEEYFNALNALNRRESDLQTEALNQAALQANREKQYSIEQQIVDKQQQLAKKKLQDEQALNRLRQGEIQAQKDLQEAEININRDQRLQELEDIKDRYDLLRLQADIFTKILAAEETLVNKRAEIEGVQATSISKIVEELNKTTEELGKEGELEQKFKRITTLINETADKQLSLVRDEASVRSGIIQSQIDAGQEALRDTETQQGLENELRKAKIDSERIEQDETKKTLQLKLDAIEQERIAIKNNFSEEALRRKDELETLEDGYQRRITELNAQEDKTRQLGSSISGLIENRVGQGFEDLFDAIASGTLTLQNFKQGVLSLFRELLADIAKEVFRQTVTQPVSQGIGSIFGGIVSSIVGIGSVSNIGPTGATFAEELVGGVRPLTNGGSVEKTGSIQRFADGGGVQLRDSVPALLEPGEFVIRKPIVNKVGAQNLEQLNATGKMGGAQNIKVEVQNSGTPKEAQQGPISFDGEKAVVKIILNDLKNNGPIKKTLRGTM